MRAFLVAAAAAALSWASPAQAALECELSGAGVRQCVASLPQAAVREMAQLQRASQWCWAAAVSMVLRGWGVNVSQEQVVRQHWGVAVDLGVPPEAMQGLLNRTWRDTAGRTVAVSTQALTSGEAKLQDVWAGAAEALAAGQPLVVAIRGHALVLVALDYEQDAGGRIVPLQARVLDPATGTVTAMRAAAPVLAVLRVHGAGDQNVAMAGGAALLR